MIPPPPAGNSTKRWAIVGACAAIAAVLLFAVLLTRGGGESTPDAGAGGPTTDVDWGGNTTNPGGGATSDDDQFLGILAGKGFMASDAELIEIGHSLCDVMDSGVTGYQLVLIAQESGLTTDQGAALVAAAVVAYCPWNRSAATS